MRCIVRSPFALVGGMVMAVTVLTLALMPGLISTLFSPGAFMPHVHCYLDNPRMIWLQGLSDFLIGLSYMMISGALAYLVFRARKDIPFEWMFLAFGVFIFSCGWTHFLEVWTLWYPTYWLSGGVKAITAAASLATAGGTFYLVPHVFRLIEMAKLSEQRRLELAQAHARLQVSNNDLKTFSYSLSHDLRAPLRTVNGMSSVLLEDYGAQLPPEAADILQRIQGAATRMDQLVNDVLALNRLSYIGVERSAIDLEILVRPLILGRMDLQAPNAEVELQRPLLAVCADSGTLSQCLDNLLGNAVKFVAPGVKPRVRVRTEARGDWVRLWVEDNGIGIPLEAQQKIFEPFQRLHRGADYPGTGIGLAIVRKGAERMGGHAGVESAPGQGSRFWIDLPAAPGGAKR